MRFDKFAAVGMTITGLVLIVIIIGDFRGNLEIRFQGRVLAGVAVGLFGMGCLLWGRITYAGKTVSFDDIEEGRYVKLGIGKRIVKLMPFTPGKKANSLLVHGVPEDVANFKEDTVFDILDEKERKIERIT